MKILLISSRFVPFTGGVENVVLNLAKEFKKQSHEVLVVASKMGKAKKSADLVEGIEVQRIWMNLPRSPLGYLAFPIRFLTGLIDLIRLISKFNPNVINYHFPDDSSVYVWLAYLLSEMPIKEKNQVLRSAPEPGSEELAGSQKNASLTLNIHGNDLQVFGKKSWYRFFLKKIIGEATRIVVNSTYIKDDLLENFPQTKEKVRIIPNGVDQKFFQLEKNQKEQDVLLSCAGCPLIQAGMCGPTEPEKETGNYALYLGRLVPKKGVDTLIKAYAKVKDELDSNLVIVGDGDERKNLENLTQKLNLENRIEFTGFKSGTDLLQYIQDACFAVIPSRREPFGIVALELAAARKAVVASNTGGLAELLEDKKTALLFENGNTEDLAKKMVALEKNAELRKTLAENAKEMARKYRWKNVAESYVKNYKSSGPVSRSAEKPR